LTRRDLLVVTVALLFLLPGPSRAVSIGVVPRDKAVFSDYVQDITQGYPTNSTWTNTSQFTLTIEGMNTTKTPGTVWYSFTVDSVNGTKTSSGSTVNTTTIFNPFDNYSYIGSAFCPFIDTSVGNGSRTKLGVVYPVNGSYTTILDNGTTVELPPIHVNSSVVRTQKLIYVFVAIPTGVGGAPFTWKLQYNSTTGILETGTLYLSEFDETRIFTYNLLSFQEWVPPNYSFIPYVVIAVIAVAAVISVVRRASPSERKVKRMKEKFKLFG
jgi:hypothetical protein